MNSVSLVTICEVPCRGTLPCHSVQKESTLSEWLCSRLTAQVSENCFSWFWCWLFVKQSKVCNMLPIASPNMIACSSPSKGTEWNTRDGQNTRCITYRGRVRSVMVPVARYSRGWLSNDRMYCRMMPLVSYQDHTNTGCWAWRSSKRLRREISWRYRLR